MQDVFFFVYCLMRTHSTAYSKAEVGAQNA
jgi:hypothetical protein